VRRILEDARNALEFNWSTSPQSEDPGGWYGFGEFIGDDFIRYSTRSYARVQDIPLPIPARRVVQYVRTDNPFTDPTLLDAPSFGTYNEPNSGPWSSAVPEEWDTTGKVNASVYVRCTRPANVVIRQTFEFGNATDSAGVVIAPNVWVRVNATFNTVDTDGFNRYFDMTARVSLTDGAPEPGDTMYLSCALFWNADEVVPFFDGEAVDTWWDLRRGRDVPSSIGQERTAGQSPSVRYKVNG
jgi:hypothetical protein